MKDQKSRDFMNQYMYPNSRDNGINKIQKIVVYGNLTENDIQMLSTVFEERTSIQKDSIVLSFDNSQEVLFIQSDEHFVEVYTTCTNSEYAGKNVEIENVNVINGN